ncbi:MAG: hypothetical protein WCO06_05590 [Candidatus Roizmanbacteria bacterium]
MSTPEFSSQPPQQPEDLSQSTQESEQDPYVFNNMGELINWLTPSGMGRAITQRQQVGTKMIPPSQNERLLARMEGPYDARPTLQADYDDVPVAYVLQTGVSGEILYLSNTGRVVQMSYDPNRSTVFHRSIAPSLQPYDSFITIDFSTTGQQVDELILDRMVNHAGATITDGADQPEIIRKSLPKAIEFGRKELKRRATNKAIVEQATLQLFSDFRRQLSIPPDENNTPPPQE